MASPLSAAVWTPRTALASVMRSRAARSIVTLAISPSLKLVGRRRRITAHGDNRPVPAFDIDGVARLRLGSVLNGRRQHDDFPVGRRDAERVAPEVRIV